MQNYGSSMSGSFVCERVQELPVWSSNDVGRGLFDYKTQTGYIGGYNNTIGVNGWIPIGLTKGSIKTQYIDWDTDLSNRPGSVSAKHVPIYYKNKPSTVQLAIDDIITKFELLKKGDYTVLGQEVVKCKQIKKVGNDAVNAECLYITNSKNVFPSSLIVDQNITIESALDYAGSRTANLINLEQTNRIDRFGTKLNFINTKTIQDALEALENYLDNLTAADIPCTYEGCNCQTNVQFVLDALYKLYSDAKFINLADVPAAHDPDKHYLKSDGSSLVWVDLLASETFCHFPNTEKVTVQQALYDLKSRTDVLDTRITNIKLDACNIAYTSLKPEYVITNVGSALDLIFNDFYSNKNKPKAVDIDCMAIGNSSNTNVQLALNYLNTQVNNCLASLPCTINAVDVPYISTYGATEVGHVLDYVLDFIDNMRTNYSINHLQYSPA